MKRIICVILAVSCVFFTGCNSILYNGNLKFESFEPVTVPLYGEELEEIAQDAQNRELEEKYKLEGVNAFYILPGHEADPEKIIDFKVLDYTTDGRFVYCYLTPCYVTDDKTGTGLGTIPVKGKAPAERSYTLENRTSSYNVQVLMSYNPYTLEYTVFYSSVSEASTTTTVENTQAAKDGDVGTITASAENASIMANRLVKSEEYFIFDNQTAYVYDKNGKEISRVDYSSIISQETERLKEKAVAGLRRQMSASKAQQTADQSEVTISDVVMDGNYYVYIPISVELPSTDNGEIDDDVENDEEFEASVYMTVVACYDLDIGGERSEIVFSSKNKNWSEQLKLWKSICVTEDTKDLMASNNIFKNEEAAKTYMKLYSMDNIKKGVVGNVPDDFPVFATSGSTVNMELAGIADLASFQMQKIGQKDNAVKGTYSGNIISLLNASEKATYGFRFSSSMSWMAYIINHMDSDTRVNEYFWKYYSKESREILMNRAREVLVLAAQGDKETLSKLDKTALNTYFLIPWLCPGVWDGKTNASPLPWKKWTLEAVFAYRTSFYSENSALSEVNRYCPIVVDGRYDSESKNPGYSMKVTEYTAKNSSRMFVYQEVTENGMIRYGIVKETLPAYPLEYRLVFPSKTKVQYIEEVDTGEMVAASSDLGGIYYMEVSSEDSDSSVSMIRYNNGYRDLLYDKSVPGKAIDAGVLCYNSAGGSEAEVVVYITDEGIKFYKKKNEVFESGLFLTLEQLAQSPSSYGLSVLGAVTQTNSSDDEKLQVTKEQDEIIQQKTEKGTSTGSYSMSNISLLSSTKAVVCSVSDGIIMVNMDNGLNLRLRDGAYYAAFPYTDSQTGSRQFMVVGYDTSEYYYESGDIAWAKCYKFDLEAENGRLEAEAMITYLDSLAGGYLTRTHRLTWSESKNAYEITGFTAEEKKANDRAETLFYKDEAAMTAELKTVAKELGFSGVNQDVLEHAKNLREKFIKQRQYLTEFYRLAGLGTVDTMPKEAWLIEQEGYLIQAAYTATLEQVLVELRLSDTAISNISDDARKKEYQEYQKQMKAVELLNSRGEESGAQDKTAIENMAFYQQVLMDVREEYESVCGDGSWDSYFLELLKGISPDCAINQQEEGLRQLCDLADISTEVTDMDELAETVLGLRRVRELEEIIVEYKLRGAAYQSLGYREKFQEYAAGSYGSEAEKDTAFYSADFYQVIRELQEEKKDTLSKTTWEQKLKDILGMCGAGIVLGEETAAE